MSRSGATTMLRRLTPLFAICIVLIGYTIAIAQPGPATGGPGTPDPAGNNAAATNTPAGNNAAATNTPAGNNAAATNTPAANAPAVPATREKLQPAAPPKNLVENRDYILRVSVNSSMVKAAASELVWEGYIRLVPTGKFAAINEVVDGIPVAIFKKYPPAADGKWKTHIVIVLNDEGVASEEVEGTYVPEQFYTVPDFKWQELRGVVNGFDLNDNPMFTIRVRPRPAPAPKAEVKPEEKKPEAAPAATDNKSSK